MRTISRNAGLWIGMLCLSCLCASVSEADPVSLSWQAPTKNADAAGTPLTDLAGYKVYQSTVAGQYGPPVATLGTVTNYTLTLPPSTLTKTYFLSVTAFDTSNNESVKAAAVSKTVIGAPIAYVKSATDSEQHLWGLVGTASPYALWRDGSCFMYNGACDVAGDMALVNGVVYNQGVNGDTRWYSCLGACAVFLIVDTLPGVDTMPPVLMPPAKPAGFSATFQTNSTGTVTWLPTVDSTIRHELRMASGNTAWAWTTLATNINSMLGTFAFTFPTWQNSTGDRGACLDMRAVQAGKPDGAWLSLTSEQRCAQVPLAVVNPVPPVIPGDIFTSITNVNGVLTFKYDPLVCNGSGGTSKATSAVSKVDGKRTVTMKCLKK